MQKETIMSETKQTALVIMAAGIGSRFGGGIKQLEPILSCVLLPLTTMITANFIFFWKEMSNTTSAMLYTNFPTVTAC